MGRNRGGGLFTHSCSLPTVLLWSRVWTCGWCGQRWRIRPCRHQTEHGLVTFTATPLGPAIERRGGAR